MAGLSRGKRKAPPSNIKTRFPTLEDEEEEQERDTTKGQALVPTPSIPTPTFPPVRSTTPDLLFGTTVVPFTPATTFRTLPAPRPAITQVAANTTPTRTSLPETPTAIPASKSQTLTPTVTVFVTPSATISQAVTVTVFGDGGATVTSVPASTSSMMAVGTEVADQQNTMGNAPPNSALGQSGSVVSGSGLVFIIVMGVVGKLESAQLLPCSISVRENALTKF
jgi:hypothetical protein